jgi:large subunit ribosomal protein L19
MKPQMKAFEAKMMKTNIPDFKPGDTLKVSLRVREGEKERLQVFQGVVIQIKGEGYRKTVTLRKISGGIAVERIVPIHSPNIATIEILKKGDVRRARLYYLRGLQGKAARIKELKKGLSEAVVLGPEKETSAPETGPVAEAPAAADEGPKKEQE